MIMIKTDKYKTIIILLHYNKYEFL